MSNIIEIECPECHGNLWIDVEKKLVVQHKKSTKKNFASFDDLLLNEKKKKETTEERFLQAKDLEQAKRENAEDIFKKSFLDDQE
ncbi:MAG: hypothetical protein GY757_37280 [bacterium]|nr:hypothetical protein [bacterium]